MTLKIDKGIKLDIQDVNIFVGDVEGIVVGGGEDFLGKMENLSS